MWENYNKHFGKDNDPILVWQSSTRDMNQNVPAKLIADALEADPPRAGAEWLAQFRSDVEGFVSREVALACVQQHVYERGPISNITFTAFCDPSGGSVDFMTVAVAHFEHAKQTVIIDAVREVRAPFSPEYVTSEFAALLKSYRCSRVIGDRYAGEWPKEQFSRFGVIYEPAAKPKSELYQDLLALLNSRRIELLDNSRAFNQLNSLERYTSRAGRDSIDHPPGQMDDLINAIAGVASILVTKSRYNVDSMTGWDVSGTELSSEEHRRRRLGHLSDPGYARYARGVGVQ